MQQAPPLKKKHKIIEVLQRFTTLIFFAGVYVLTSMSMIFIYFFFFYILQILICMIECISIKMISKRNLEYYPITKEDVFCYKSIYFIGSFFKVSVEEPYFYGIKLKLKYPFNNKGLNHHFLSNPDQY